MKSLILIYRKKSGVYKILSWTTFLFASEFWPKFSPYFLALILRKAKWARSNHQEVFLGKGVLKICSKFIEEHPCRSVISIKLLCIFIEIALRYGCSPVSLLHNFRTTFSKNTCGWLLLISLDLYSRPI